MQLCEKRVEKRTINKPGSPKVAKGLQSVKVFSSTVPQKPKRSTELAHQRGHFEIFHPSCRKSSITQNGALLVKKN